MRPKGPTPTVFAHRLVGGLIVRVAEDDQRSTSTLDSITAARNSSPDCLANRETTRNGFGYDHVTANCVQPLMVRESNTHAETGAAIAATIAISTRTFALMRIAFSNASLLDCRPGWQANLAKYVQISPRIVLSDRATQPANVYTRRDC